MKKILNYISNLLEGSFSFLILIISIICAIFPVFMLDLNFIFIFILLAIQQIPFIGDIASAIITVCGLIKAINGPQDIYAILYYIFCVIMLPIKIITAISYLITFFSSFTNNYDEKKD